MLSMLILILLPAVRALFCPNFYDYTGDRVQCINSCPPSSKVKDKKCLLANQYVVGQSVHLCQNGWVDPSNSICCGKDYYITINNNNPACTKCLTRVYGNGKLCCPGSSYADFTNPNASTCTPLGTGQCSWLTIKNTFQVCCPSGLMYSIQQQKCVSPANYNCDNDQKICCGLNKKLQYLNKQFICVQSCNWNSNTNLFCRRKFCNAYDLYSHVGPGSFQSKDLSLKLALSQCCYGLTPSGACINDTGSCFKRFANMGWAVCCNSGQFYSLKTNACSSNCDGIILFQFFCITQGNILNFQSLNGKPSQVQSTFLCNNKKVSQIYPVCCPPGFYINDTNGCQLCNGRVFTVNTNQICCSFNEVYDDSSSSCKICSGTINRQGTLCCQMNQYISYSASGVASCTQSCIQEKMFKTNYCCESMGTQCQNRLFNPTVCSYSYLVQGACQGCPNFCDLQQQVSQMCSIGDTTQCQKKCESGTLYSAQLKQCLSCDSSCLQCYQPFDENSCSSCRDGFTNRNGQCIRCSAECLTCSGDARSCTSCPLNSSNPIFYQSFCMPSCTYGKYFQLSNKTCSNCFNGCLQCNGPTTFQCLKCPQTLYLSSVGQGSCQRCASGCLICYSSPASCYQCQSSSYLQNNQCKTFCSPGFVNQFNPSLNHFVCLKCHSNCAACDKSPSNCLSCRNSSFYLNNQLGVNLCSQCNQPCLTCSSASTCLTCSSGYFLSSSSCERCHTSCSTCINNTQTGCTSCIGQSQLISGKCIGCSSLCQTCDSQQNCLLCKPSYFIYNGMCTSQCPAFSYTVQTKCVDCPTNCSSCTSATECISCSVKFPYSLNKTCLADCPSGYIKIGSSCVLDYKNNTNNSSNNNTNTNNTNNSNNNNSNTNNSNGSSLINIQSQKISMDDSKNMTVVTTVDKTLSNVSLVFYLLNTKTNERIKLTATPVLVTKSDFVRQATGNDITYNVAIPDGANLKDSILQTQVAGAPNSTLFFNSKSIFDFILYDYVTDPLKGLQYVGLTFTILILIFTIITKLKGHFIAQQANTIILHMVNFIQVVYLFKFTQLHTQGMYHFLNGFGFMHILMFPNFFYSIIPSGYNEYPAEKSLIPDGNFIRNAGSSISFMVIVLLVLLIAIIVCYVVYKTKQLDQMPQIRKITRVGILALHFVFLNILFTGFNYVIHPFISPSSQFRKQSTIASVIMLVVVVTMCILIIVHFYKTYNSDVLQHYYTIRQAIQYVQILCQAFIFVFAIGKPLLCLCLVGLQLIWLGSNYMLYKYGEGDKIKHHVKFLVATTCIIISYIMLSLAGNINWIAIVVVVSMVVVVLIVYSTYQIVGLYYSMLFKEEVKTQNQAVQTNDARLEDNKESATQF